MSVHMVPIFQIPSPSSSIAGGGEQYEKWGKCSVGARSDWYDDDGGSGLVIVTSSMTGDLVNHVTGRREIDWQSSRIL